MDTKSPEFNLPSRETRSGELVSDPEDELPSFGVRSNNIGYTGQSLPEAKDYFLLFFCPEIMDTFIASTNAFAKTTKKKYWRELTLDEFKTFLAIILHLGMVKPPSRSDAWSLYPRYGNDWVKSMMSKTRFE